MHACGARERANGAEKSCAREHRPYVRFVPGLCVRCALHAWCLVRGGRWRCEGEQCGDIRGRRDGEVESRKLLQASTYFYTLLRNSSAGRRVCSEKGTGAGAGGAVDCRAQAENSGAPIKNIYPCCWRTRACVSGGQTIRWSSPPSSTSWWSSVSRMSASLDSRLGGPEGNCQPATWSGHQRRSIALKISESLKSG